MSKSMLLVIKNGNRVCGTNNETNNGHDQVYDAMTFKTTTISFLYDNPIGKYLMNEESSHSFWNGCRDPFQKGVITLATRDEDLINSDSMDELLHKYIMSIPRCKLLKGTLLLQGYMVSPRFMKSLDTFDIRPDDIFIASYPRSGTTWTEEVVSAIASKFDPKFMSKQVHDRVVHLEVGRPFGQKSHLKSLKSPRLLGTHLPSKYCPLQLQQLKCKVIYVIRNPKDQAVSYYHFHETAKYLGGVKWNWDEFIQLYLRGDLVYGSWFQHVKGWFQLSHDYPDKVLVILYEELQVNLRGMTHLISQFIGHPVSDDLLDKIVNHCTFNQMKNNPAVNRTQVPLKDCFKDNSKTTPSTAAPQTLNPTGLSSQPLPINGHDTSNTKFMRKGIIGDWKNYFTEEQSEKFDRMIKETFKGMGLKFAFDDEEARKLCYSSLDGRILSIYNKDSRRPSTAPAGLFKSPFVVGPVLDPDLENYRHIPGDEYDDENDEEEDDDDFEVDIRHLPMELKKPSKKNKVTEVKELNIPSPEPLGSKVDNKKRNSDPGAACASNEETKSSEVKNEMELTNSNNDSPKHGIVETFTEIAL